MTLAIDAYAAGLLDGEGCLYIATRAGKIPHPRVDVGMTKPGGKVVLKMLEKEFGGKVRLFRKATGQWAEAWAWHLTSWPEAEALLRRVEPHLRVKKEQALLILRACAIHSSMPVTLGGRHRWTKAGLADVGTLGERVKEMNRKGPPEEVKPGWIAKRVGDRWYTPQGSLFHASGLTPFTGPWPTAGILTSKYAYATPNSGECPSGGGEHSSLQDVLETEPPPPRFSLSPRACAGVLRRAARRGRELPPALRAALEAGASLAPSASD